MKNIFILFLFVGSFAMGCKSDTSTKNQKQDEPKKEVKTMSGNKYTLTPFTESTSYPDAEIVKMDYKNGKFNYSISDGAYKLASQTPDAAQKMCANSAQGQHIHLIVDDKPYAAKYTNEFDYEIDDGEHYLLSFLSRSYHESIKTDKAHVAKKVMIKDNTITSSADIEEPMLFYSRPKGSYTGKSEIEKVMLDFYPVNVEIGNGYHVIVTINGEEHKVDKWQPYYIEGLEVGENTVQLALVASDDSKLAAPFNPVSRTFKIRDIQEPVRQ